MDGPCVRDAEAVTAPVADGVTRRRRGRGADRWSDWWLTGTFGFWTVLAVVDRDWNRALSPAVLLVGFAVHVLLRRMRRPGAATAVVVAAIACVLVVSIVQQAWVMAVVMGIGLLVMGGIWAPALWPDESGGATDDAS
jgi:nitroreductase